jgi:hypothetical protein
MNVSTHAVLADAKSQPMRVCVIFASIIGNALEWYDFTVYAFLGRGSYRGHTPDAR